MSPEAVTIMTMPHRCVIRWERTGKRGGPWAATVQIGTLPDGQRYVWVISQVSDNKARLYPDEQSARDVAHRWRKRIGGDWEQVPCSPTQGWQPGEREDQQVAPDDTGSDPQTQRHD